MSRPNNQALDHSQQQIPQDGVDNGLSFTLQPDNPHHLANLQGYLNDNLKLIESRLKVQINNRGNRFLVVGEKAPAQAAERVLQQLYRDANKIMKLAPTEFISY